MPTCRTCLPPPPTAPGPADEEGPSGRAPPQTYAEEQEDLKRAFLSAFEEAEGGEGGGGDGAFGAGELKQRAGKAGKAADQAAGEGARAAAPGGGGGGGAADTEARVQQLLDGYFGRDEELSKEDRFLKRYILNKVIGQAALRRGGGAAARSRWPRPSRCADLGARVPPHVWAARCWSFG